MIMLYRSAIFVLFAAVIVAASDDDEKAIVQHTRQILQGLNGLEHSLDISITEIDSVALNDIIAQAESDLHMESLTDVPLKKQVEEDRKLAYLPLTFSTSESAKEFLSQAIRVSLKKAASSFLLIQILNEICRQWQWRSSQVKSLLIKLIGTAYAMLELQLLIAAKQSPEATSEFNQILNKLTENETFRSRLRECTTKSLGKKARLIAWWFWIIIGVIIAIIMLTPIVFGVRKFLRYYQAAKAKTQITKDRETVNRIQRESALRAVQNV